MPPEVATELLKLGFPGAVIVALLAAVYKLYSGRLDDWQKNTELNIRMAVALELSNKAREEQTEELRRLGIIIANLESSCRQMREDMLRMKPA